MAFNVLGAREVAPHLMLGFDGIAFDQFIKAGMFWSATLAAIVLLMVVQAGLNRSVTLSGALRELWQRSGCLLPAIMAVALFQFGLSFVQAFARSGVHLFGRRQEHQPSSRISSISLSYSASPASGCGSPWRF